MIPKEVEWPRHPQGPVDKEATRPGVGLDEWTGGEYFSGHPARSRPVLRTKIEIMMQAAAAL